MREWQRGMGRGTNRRETMPFHHSISNPRFFPVKAGRESRMLAKGYNIHRSHLLHHQTTVVFN